MLDTVLPLVRERFPRVRPTPGQLGIAGYSLGGLMSAYALFTRRGTFDRAGCGSPSFWWHHRVMERDVLPRALRATPARGAGLRCWVDMGAAEGEELMVAAAARAVALLEAAGMRRGDDLMHELEDGGFHETNSFLRRLRRCLMFLYAPPAIAAKAATAAGQSRL